MKRGVEASQLGIEIIPTGPVPAADEASGFNPRGLQRRLGHDYRIFQLASGGEPRKLGIGLPDGMMISANVLSDRPRPPFLGGPWMMTLLFASSASPCSACGRRAH